MKQILSLFVMLLTPLLIACSFGGPTGSQGDVIWPLSIGSEWRGVATFYDSEGNATNEMPMNFLVSGDTIIENKTWFFLSTYTDDQPVAGSNWLVANRADGLHQILLPIAFRENEFQADDNLWMKYPARIGDSYRTYNGEIVVVKSTDQYTTVPQGSRDCFVYEYLRADGFARHYAAPGIGLVKIEVEIASEVGPGVSKVAPGWIWELQKLIVN